MSFSEVWRLHARFRPNRPAIIHPGGSISFSELNPIIDGIAWRLTERGIKRGELVGVGLSDTWQHLVLLIALSRVGAVTLPIDCRWTDGERLSVTGHFEADHVLIDEGELLEKNWQKLGEADFKASGTAYLDPDVSYDSPMLLSLSSGTTGLPKGPLATQRQIESRFLPYFIDLGMNGHDRFVAATPLYFGAGRGFALGTLHCGATVCMFPPPYTPQELVDYINKVEATSIFLVPTLIRRLFDVAGAAPLLPTIRKLISSGSALFMEERRAIREKLTPHLYEMYASTEGGSVSVLSPEDFAQYPESVGKPCFRVQVEVVDNAHKPLPAGEVGRLRYRSPASAQSYYKGDSSEAFRDGFFYPGDLAALNEDGYVFLRGRFKDMIIRGGINIYPGDIESVLLQADGVSEAAVVPLPSKELGEEIAAFVTVRDSSVQTAQLMEFCAGKLTSFKRPRLITIIDAMPRNSLGKILKEELKKRLAEAET